MNQRERERERERKERERLEMDEIYSVYESAIEMGMESAILKAGEKGAAAEVMKGLTVAHQLKEGMNKK